MGESKSQNLHNFLDITSRKIFQLKKHWSAFPVHLILTKSAFDSPTKTNVWFEIFETWGLKDRGKPA